MKRKVYFILACSTLVNPAYAEEAIKKGLEDDHTQALDEDTIIVRSTPTSQTTGTQMITADQIQRMPIRNGSITELLKNNPNVQFANSSDNGNTPGELQPENVSFHGEKFYQNNFMIDGLSNNNTINPGANGGELIASPDGYSPTDLPAGGAQSFWINSELIESAEVFDSNISAKYGNFTGGVVDAKLKKPNLTKAGGRVSYRTTNDHLTQYHVNESIQTDFDRAVNLYYQPEFNKQFYSLSLNQPLSERLGIVFSYNRQQSDIGYFHPYLNKKDQQQRLSETYLLKAIYLTDGGDTFNSTVMYSPHESKYFKKDIQNGAYTNTGGGYRFNLDWEHVASWGQVKSLIGYQYEQNDIQHEVDYYANWYSKYLNQASSVIDWNSTGSDTTATRFGQYGGYGHYATEKTTTTVKQDYELHPIQWQGITHQFDLGWEINAYQARYQRFNDVYMSRGSPTWSKSTACQVADPYCIAGEQYFKSRTRYPARTVEGDYVNYAVYLQNSMLWKNLEVTPGLRLNYDDLLGNFNISPRLATSWDVFGNRHTRLFAGANRYHAQGILAYKLRQGIGEYSIETRTDSMSAWKAGSALQASYDYNISKLKTPYSDELNFGLSQHLGQTVWTLKYVNRQGRDQFGRNSSVMSNGQKYYYLDNTGHTEGNTVSLTIEPISPYEFKYAQLKWMFAANYTKNKSSSQTYYDLSNTDQNMVIFKGKLMEKGDMEALDFNTPWTAFFNLDLTIPKIHLDWSQRIGYTAGYRSYSTSTVNCVEYSSICGNYDGNATLYMPIKYKNYFSYDWHFNYRQPMFKDHVLDITLDVMNVFNKAIATDQLSTLSRTSVNKTGRQFWLGAAWSW